MVMNRKTFKELSKEVDKRAIDVFESFNEVIFEYEENGKTDEYFKLLKKARKDLIIALIANKQMATLLREQHKAVAESNIGLFTKIKLSYYIAKTHNYYASCSEVLTETAKENGILGENETKIDIREVLKNE